MSGQGSRPEWVSAEIDGMHRQRQVDSEAFAVLLEPPHPIEVSRAAGAMMGPLDRRTAYMAAYLLRDAGLLPPEADRERLPILVFYPEEEQ